MGVELRSGHKTGNGSFAEKKAADDVGTPILASSTNWVVFVGLLIDLLAFTLILPLFPALLDHYKRHDGPDGLYSILDSNVAAFGRRLGAPEQFNSVLFGGLLGSLFSFLQFTASPVVGGLSDHFGRKPLLLISTAGVAFSYALWASASTFSIFVAARIVGGLSKGNVSLATAIIADVSTPKTRQRGMALIGMAFSVGFLAGPLIGAAFSIWAKGSRDGQWFAYPALVALSLSLFDLAFFAVKFKETLEPAKRLASLDEALVQALSYINPVSLFNFESLKNLKQDEKQSLRTIGRTYFVYLFLYSGLEFTLTFLTHLRFNFTSMDQGKMFLYIGVVMAAVQGGYVRRIPQGRERAMVLRGLLVIVPSFALIGFARNLATLYAGITLYALSTAVVVPCMTTMASNHGTASQKGIVMGVYRSLGALGRALGPVVASVTYWCLGPEMCYSLGGLGLLVPYLMLKRMKAM